MLSALAVPVLAGQRVRALRRSAAVRPAQRGARGLRSLRESRQPPAKLAESMKLHRVSSTFFDILINL